MGETVGSRLRQAREARGLTQAQLAQQVGAKSGRAATVSEWEQDKGGLAAETLAEICVLLNINGHWLLTGQEEMEPTPPDEAQQRLRLVRVALDADDVKALVGLLEGLS